MRWGAQEVSESDVRRSIASWLTEATIDITMGHDLLDARNAASRAIDLIDLLMKEETNAGE